MKRKKDEKKNDELAILEHVKRLAVKAMFSDDDLMETLVLKGGNAMALIHQLTSRESVDLDFSMQHDFTDGVEAMTARIERALQRTFPPAGYMPFDLKMAERPATIPPEMADFWGGYAVEFKLITLDQFARYKENLEQMRREALSVGQGKKFLIDISRFEYIADKEESDLDGYRIYVYSPTMIACEKLRALCQQMAAYASIVKRKDDRPGSQRARDFLDIHTLVERLRLDLTSQKAIDITRHMFTAKHVPLALLGHIEAQREFHRQGFPSVQATVASGFQLKSFDFYFDYVVDLAKGLLEAAREAEKAGQG